MRRPWLQGRLAVLDLLEAECGCTNCAVLSCSYLDGNQVHAGAVHSCPPSSTCSFFVSILARLRQEGHWNLAIIAPAFLEFPTDSILVDPLFLSSFFFLIEV